MDFRNGACALILAATFAGGADFTATLANFAAGHALIRFDADGQALDAHDGEIALFEGTYYLYGTSYACGFRWQQAGAPFCGFKVYSSTDLAHWRDCGFLFDARGKAWQDRCGGGGYGCYRPHVLYNKATGKYVLWINVYDNRSGYMVFTAPSPVGPFTEAPEPVLGVNRSAPAGGLNNGDHDLFLDDDGTAWLAYTDWVAGGSIVVERLDADFLSGTGSYARVTPARTEAPALFRRGNRYYLAYSDPNCGYCATGTSYRSAEAILGPWSGGSKLSGNSCGGQPSFVSVFPGPLGPVHLYGSDLWNDAAKNEALAGYYWAPLRFSADGAIQPLDCADTARAALSEGAPSGPYGSPADADAATGDGGFAWHSDLRDPVRRIQSFTVTRTGRLTEVSFASFRDGDPDAPLRCEVRRADGEGKATGPALAAAAFPPDSVGWAPGWLSFRPNLAVAAGERYALLLFSETKAGRYGMAYSDAWPYRGGVELYSGDGGAGYRLEAGRSLRFRTRVSAPAAAAGRGRVARAARREAIHVGVDGARGRMRGPAIGR